MATGLSDCVEDDGDADRLALTLSALRIVHDVNTVQISEANLRLRSENEYLRSRLHDCTAGVANLVIGEFYQFSTSEMYSLHVSKDREELMQDRVLNDSALRQWDGQALNLTEQRYPLAGPVYRYIGYREGVDYSYPYARRKRSVSVRSYEFELPILASTVPGEPLEEDCVSKNGFVLIEIRDATLHWLERVEEPHNITLLTGEPGRYGQVPAWLGFGPLC